MKLSVKVDYACRVLAQIARQHGTNELAHVESLARDEAVPANYLAQILSELRDGGLINSRRGKQGGYTLARSPDEITLYDIVKLVEGEIIELMPKAKASRPGASNKSGAKSAPNWKTNSAATRSTSSPHAAPTRCTTFRLVPGRAPFRPEAACSPHPSPRC